MEWQDTGIVLSATRNGEHDAVLDVMTENHGRARGFVKGGMGRRNKANLQPGNLLSLTWRSRLETNLGRFTLELVHSPLGLLMGDGARMAALAAITAVVNASMPERESHTSVYHAMKAVLDVLEHDEGTLADWSAALARLELGILSELGYGLDLSECAATGSKDNLIYVSPKSARAVSAEAGLPYKGKLLALPEFLLANSGNALAYEQALEGLRLTGFFLERNIWVIYGKGQPAARERLLSSLQEACS